MAGLLAATAAASCTREGSGADEGKLEELTERIEKLEKAQAKVDEMESFLRPIMNEQKAKEAEQAAREPDPAARFAVDITGNAYDGPVGAPVTIVEAFDFA
jgi:hypothetical protein